MRSLTFLLGGARSGKSRIAEALAGQSAQVLYLATGMANDAEMAERIARHQADRPPAWVTVEEGYSPAAALQAVAPGTTVLLDCLSFLVTNHLLQEEATCEAAVRDELDALLALDLHLIIVSNEVGMSVVPEYKLGRLFRDALGRANQYVAARAERVYVCWAGIPVDIKQLAAEVAPHG